VSPSWGTVPGAMKCGCSSYGGLACYTNSGAQFAFLSSIATMSQTITGLSQGSSYTLSWAQATRPNCASCNLNDITVKVDGSTVYSLSNVGLGWVFETSGIWVASSTSALVEFVTSNPNGGKLHFICFRHQSPYHWYFVTIHTCTFFHFRFMYFILSILFTYFACVFC
jgi:hypothetical protein